MIICTQCHENYSSFYIYKHLFYNFPSLNYMHGTSGVFIKCFIWLDVLMALDRLLGISLADAHAQNAHSYCVFFSHHIPSLSAGEPGSECGPWWQGFLQYSYCNVSWQFSTEENYIWKMKKLTFQEQGSATVHRNHDSRHSYWNLATLFSEIKDISSWDTASIWYSWAFLM